MKNGLLTNIDQLAISRETTIELDNNKASWFE
jgi:hypothetical protein